MEKSIVVPARMSLASVGDDSDASSDTELFSSFRGIDKGYYFFRSGHVQQIEMVGGEEFSFVRCNVLKRIPPLLPSQFAVNSPTVPTVTHETHENETHIRILCTCALNCEVFQRPE